MQHDERLRLQGNERWNRGGSEVGCGIGLERLMMALTGTENIRDVTFYPRDVDRLTP